MSDGAEIVVTLGRCDDMRAEIFVRPRGVLAPGGAIVGTVTGPRRHRDATLPTSARLVPLPAEGSTEPVSRAILTEPAFWTPDLPNLYRIEAHVEPAARGRVDRWIGLRRLGVRGRSFWLDGRRWVPRAVGSEADLSRARAAGVGIVVQSPDDKLLATTDEKGVAVVAVLSDSRAIGAAVAALAGHPSAMFVIMPSDAVDADSIAAVRRLKGTLQIGVIVDGRRPPGPLPEGIDFVILLIPCDQMPDEAWRSPHLLPRVAWRRDGVGNRSACDILQRDLASWGLAGGNDRQPWDWAGYLVGEELSGVKLS